MSKIINKTKQGNPNIPLSELVHNIVQFKAITYPDVFIELDIHADDHGHVIFYFENSFQGKPVSIVEEIARTQMSAWQLSTVIRQEHLADGSVGLHLGIPVSGKIFGDLTSQIEKYLDELAQKVVGHSV
jgi:translation initiation factor 1 (eIF-1/SUI1)